MKRHKLLESSKKRLNLGAAKKIVKEWWATRATETFVEDDLVDCTIPTVLKPGE
jgi:hypothetical protein